MSMRFRFGYLGLALLLLNGGCFYPPPPKPLPPATNELALDLPYDMAWDAVNAVIAKNDFKVSARDPNNGVIEAQSPKFTLKDADCGMIKGVAGTYQAEPGAAASAVYNFYVKPTGQESSKVTVTATYTAPLVAPFHPPQEIQCVSTGAAEAHLLEEVRAQAAVTHRPEFAAPGATRATPISGAASIMNPPTAGGTAVEGSGEGGQALPSFGASPAPKPGEPSSVMTGPSLGPPPKLNLGPSPAANQIPNLNSLGTQRPAATGGSSGAGGTGLLPIPSF
jgi:hypothetical protein